MLDRDAIVIGDGGDFVSFAGRVMETYEPGCWLDPGPFGCLGSGPGYAIAAKLARPDKQVCLLLGDGAFGFSGMEFDTMVRHGLPVVAVVGNNGIWALEKHPMEFLYGYSVAAELRPETRYDQVVEALGGHGELVEKPGRAAAGARARVRVGQAGLRERADGPDGRLPAQREPGLDAAAADCPETRYAQERRVQHRLPGGRRRPDRPACSCRASSRTSRCSGRSRDAARFFERLASFSRLIMFDKRGTGAVRPRPVRAPRRSSSAWTTCAR